MERAMLGDLNQEQIKNLLSSQMIGRLGCHADDKTYVVPVTYAYDKEYLYMHTQEGMKIKMMRKNPQVCFEVDRVENMANWQSAVVWGTYEELNGKEAERALQTLVNRVMPLVTSQTSRPRYGLDKPHAPINPKMKTVVFRIKMTETTGRFEKSY
ncbi:MAG: pyridoxamine 5'-phosphate oxidase family protein [Cyclobacteriaceae bacterium]